MTFIMYYQKSKSSNWFCFTAEQGMDDHVVPSSMSDHIARVLPDAIVHKLSNEGHFSYFFFCDECHRQILSTLFGPPQGPTPIVSKEETKETQLEENEVEKSLIA